MAKKRHLLLYYGFPFAIYIFFIILALNIRVLWVSAIFVLVFGSGIAIPILWKYHYNHSGKREKEWMIAQKQINSHYYNQWYTPADSTELDYQTERIKKRKALADRTSRRVFTLYSVVCWKWNFGLFSSIFAFSRLTALKLLH